MKQPIKHSLLIAFLVAFVFAGSAHVLVPARIGVAPTDQFPNVSDFRGALDPAHADLISCQTTSTTIIFEVSDCRLFSHVVVSVLGGEKRVVPLFSVICFAADCKTLAKINLYDGKTDPTIEYYLTDHLGSPFAMYDENGTQTWPPAGGNQQYHPYGEMFDAPYESSVGFTGKFVDSETGQYYFNARYMTNEANPDTGPPQFLSPDSVGGSVGDPLSWNRYGYCLGNPVNNIDPDGRVTHTAHGGVNVFENMTGGKNWWVDFGGYFISDFFGLNSLAENIAVANTHTESVGTRLWAGTKATLQSTMEVAGGEIVGAALRPFGKLVSRSFSKISRTRIPRISNPISSRGAQVLPAEIVERAMSIAEAKAIKKSNLLSRGGRPGPFYVSDAVNTNALRARQRLALPQTPEVKLRLEVPENIFSSPSRVDPFANMPGGGMERIAPGDVDIPVKVIQEFLYY